MNEQVYNEQLERIYSQFSSEVLSLRTEIDGLNTVISNINLQEHESFMPHVSRKLNSTLLSWSDDGGDSGDTAWMLAASGLVLMMTLPGLVLFYSGMIRTKNVLTTVMQVRWIDRTVD